MLDTILFIVQCIGVVSFAITGTIIAIHKKTDFIGALAFALLTCFGGGMLRDITLGHIPSLFIDRDLHIMAVIGAGTSLICFHLAFFKPVARFIGKHRHSFFLELADALGLSSFCVLGVDAARNLAGENAIPLVLIFGGFITGVGGGMLRDICSAEIPAIFRKNVYLIPAVLGSALYTLTYPYWPRLVSMFVSIALIIVIRVLAYCYKWNLPIHKDQK